MTVPMGDRGGFDYAGARGRLRTDSIMLALVACGRVRSELSSLGSTLRSVLYRGRFRSWLRNNYFLFSHSLPVFRMETGAMKDVEGAVGVEGRCNMNSAIDFGNYGRPKDMLDGPSIFNKGTRGTIMVDSISVPKNYQFNPPHGTPQASSLRSHNFLELSCDSNSSVAEEDDDITLTTWQFKSFLKESSGVINNIRAKETRLSSNRLPQPEDTPTEGEGSLWQPKSHFSWRKLEERALSLRGERVELEREKILGEGVWRGFYTVAPASSHRSTSKSRFVLREVLKKKTALVSKVQVLCLLQEEEKEVKVLCLTGSLWQPKSHFSWRKLEERALSLRGERVELEREKSLGERVWRGFYMVAPASSHRSTSKSRFVLREVLKKKTVLVSKDQVICLLQEEEKEVKIIQYDMDHLGIFIKWKKIINVEQHSGANSNNTTPPRSSTLRHLFLTLQHQLLNYSAPRFVLEIQHFNIGALFLSPDITKLWAIKDEVMITMRTVDSSRELCVHGGEGVPLSALANEIEFRLKILGPHTPDSDVMLR
ncbi:hypothetical protein M5K25_006908 [Dendrobium thyrsiflorum]|uniref:Uncharacterized protein n=1 Tax=Dendrobium thyrsiflorum TaxID=117978 RepID=A0ABD0VDV8_DENTH